MFSKLVYYSGLVACIALIISCFIPWVHYNQINETFTGYHVTRFAGGDYYGRAGIPITVIALLVFIFMLLPQLWAKRVNLFLSGLLFAYCIRTYIIFTSSLFEEDLHKHAGIYLIILFSLIILISSILPKEKAPKQVA